MMTKESDVVATADGTVIVQTPWEEGACSNWFYSSLRNSNLMLLKAFTERIFWLKLNCILISR